MPATRLTESEFCLERESTVTPKGQCVLSMFLSSSERFLTKWSVSNLTSCFGCQNDQFDRRRLNTFCSDQQGPTFLCRLLQMLICLFRRTTPHTLSSIALGLPRPLIRHEGRSGRNRVHPTRG